MAAAALLPSTAEAQSAWGGTGSTTTTTDYYLGTNWSNPPAGAPPIAVGQSAAFGATGASSVVVTAGPIAPDSWTFNAASQSYVITGQAVNFGTGLTNNASAGQAISISNNLSGSSLSQAAASTLTLSGTSSFANTTISAGTIALSGAGSLGNSLVNVGNGAATATLDISGTGAGTAIQGLEGASDGAVTLGNQTLTSTAGSSANIFYGAINGNGGLTVSGGMQILGGANTYGGVTTIDSGAMLGINGSGSIASSSKVVDNGALDISVSFGASIKSLAGTNASGLVLLGNQTLTITAANDSFAGAINNGGGGTGGLTLTGGTETLTGTNGYTGATTISGGTLNVNGSIAASSLTAVTSGGTLAGTGVVGNTSIAGGSFAPGSGTPGSSMTVNGTLGFTAASSYAVNINPATSSLANVTGTAVLGGATVQANYASGSYVAKQYTILTAGNVSGSFGSLVNSNLPANFSASLSYDARDAFLNLALNFTPPSDPSYGGLNANQRNVANTLTNFFNATGGIPLVFGALTPAGLTQVSGETAVGTQQTTFEAMTEFMGLMTDPFIGGRGDGVAAPGGGASSYASTQNAGGPRDAYAMFDKAPVTAFDQRWSVWAAGFGGSQTTDGNTTLGSNSTTSRVYGSVVGADYRFSPYTLAGFSLAGGGTNFSVNGSGSGRSDLFQAGAFVRHSVGPAYISAALAYGWQDITTDRTVTVAGVDTLQARFNANAFSGRLEGGYRFVEPVMGGIGVTPYAAAQFTTFDLPAYAEGVLAGAGTFALSYGAKDVTDPRSELGIRTDTSYALTDAILTLRGRLAWAYDFDPDRSVAATFQTLPGASFVVNGAAQAHDAALTTASAEIRWSNGFSLAATFEGEFSDVTRSYAGKGVVRYQW